MSNYFLKRHLSSVLPIIEKVFGGKCTKLVPGSGYEIQANMRERELERERERESVCV